MTNRWLARVAAPILCLAAAFALYEPALRIGLLSDDYALLMWARQLELAPLDWGQIRPLPILSWWLLAWVTPAAKVPAAIHVLNVALHGTNALVVGLLARRLTTSATAAIGAAALFLVMPISVEPVAWGSGVFDVMLATSALLLSLVVTSRPELRARDQAAVLVLALLMLAAKETGVIAGLLVLLLAWVRWSRLTRRVVALAAALVMLAGAYTLARELTGRLDHRFVPRPDLLSVARLIAGTGRAFLVPLHRDIVGHYPGVAIVCGGGILVVLAAWGARCRERPHVWRIVGLAMVGTFVCVLPAIRLFGITADLQGTRYVYLASAWWSILLASALLEGWTSRGSRRAAVVLLVFLTGAAAAVTRRHLEYWVAAGAERDRVLGTLVQLPLTCRQVSASGVPDNVGGAYVFRNGLNEALTRLGRSFEWVEPAQAQPDCRVSLER